MSQSSGVELYWLPLDAGGHSVRLNTILYEALRARPERRAACDLYHSALEVRVPDGRAPGWQAGVVVARRQVQARQPSPDVAPRT